MLLAGLIVIAVALTCAMFATRQMMLGFPCLIFWAVTGGYCYHESVATWDMYYFTFFASMFMGIFCAFAAFALRTKKEEAREGDLFFDEGGDRDIKFIDESGSGKDAGTVDENREKPGARARGIRERAEKRRARWE